MQSQRRQSLLMKLKFDLEEFHRPQQINGLALEQHDDGAICHRKAA